MEAGVEATRTGREHDVLHEHAVIDPTASGHSPIDGEDEPDRRVEEAEVARVLAMHRVLVALGDAEQCIEFEAVAAASTEVGLYELGRVDVVLRPVLAGFMAVGMQYALA